MVVSLLGFTNLIKRLKSFEDMAINDIHTLVFICASTIFFVGIILVITFVSLHRKKIKYLKLESEFQTFS